MPRIPKTEKAKERLEKMKESRKEDSRNLRKDIEDKLTWAIEQKKKGLEVIEKQLQQVKENKDTMLELTGIIKVLSQLLEEDKKIETKTEEKKD